MRTIFKYPFTDGQNSFAMPRGARILHLATQNGTPTLWAEVDTEQPGEVREFRVIGTGHEVPPLPCEYIGTYLSGPFVWHVYEIPTLGWTSWAGGDCPVFGSLVVEYRQRNGKVFEAPAAALVWQHEGDEADIMAYRLAAEQPE
jgi:hypothetical protein